MKAIMWAILVCGCIYFMGGIVYSLGYRQGLSEAKCGPAQCMSQVIKAEQVAYKRCGRYK